ncbi:natterin-3-like [Seriola aureovittata]|uniref:natterin-3-like n=1 Tax=Seriola aureovittata TaxID=2871759 RepID=UPI0024BD5CEA|nr:natterin-3-like [Seriola aureovittata]
MKLPVLLLLALPALSSADSCVCEKNTEPVQVLDPSLADRVPEITGLPSVAAIGNISSPFTSFMFNQNKLEWQTFGSSPADGSISIYNGYVGRIDYVCKYGCEAGFYNPNMGPYCHYPYAGKEYRGSPFEILVNKDNFEFMEWKDGSYGSVPQNSVKTCADSDKYVGKNKFGLGKVHVRNEAFFLPWQGSEYWYKYYQVLTFNKEITSEDISDVKYKTDGVNIIKYPPESMQKSAITNRACQPVTETATLSKTNQEEQRWDTSFSLTLGVKTSITAGVPEISSASIEFSVETTLQFTKGTTYIKSTTHTVSVQHEVPPNHSCGVSMVAYKYSADIPFTARLSRTYSNGETRWTSISGTYKGVQVGEVRAVVDRCEPLPDARPCE